MDSTVIQEEGIDELAAYCGKGQEVSALTRDAMAGSMTFQEALKRRLDIIKPSQTQISDFLRSNPSTLSPGIRFVISHLNNNTALQQESLNKVFLSYLHDYAVLRLFSSCSIL